MSDDSPDLNRPHPTGTTERNALLGPALFLPLVLILVLAAGLFIWVLTRA